ncbi:GntR family transcriptional regulator [Listeria ilorinensis]|uniref:GntR family transcriptional regulator n=1 Tax=Listeria ilorinensis TaxID=2867439 RepID=UPI001EF5B3AD|nr:GntR family transcriptional regulator [Listeria ilorinensis]
MKKRLLYQQVHEKLVTKIQSGSLPVGEKLPSEAELMNEFGVSSITLKKALELLKTEGYISRRPRVGSYVISDRPAAEHSETRTFDRPLIGCVMTDFDDTFGTKLLSGMLDEEEGKAHLLLKKSHGDLHLEEKIVQEFIEMNVAGLIMLPASSKFVSPALLELATQKFPLIVLDRSLEGLPISSISTDNITAAKMITALLFQNGHQNIAMMTSKSEVSTLENRIDGFIRAHASFHNTYQEDYIYRKIESVIPNSNVAVDTDIAHIVDFLQARPEITAVVAAEYNIALMLRQACKALGKKIPEDLSIVCFDHPDQYFDHLAFRFTHIKQSQYKMGKKAITSLLEQIIHPEKVQKHVFDPVIIEGDSVYKRN